MPKYTYTHDRGSFWRGDSIPAMSLKLEREADDEIILPLSVCAQIRNKYGRLLHEYKPKIDGGRVVLDEVSGAITAGFPIGVHTYDIEYRFKGGIAHTYVNGTIEILEDISRC